MPQPMLDGPDKFCRAYEGLALHMQQANILV